MLSAGGATAGGCAALISPALEAGGIAVGCQWAETQSQCSSDSSNRYQREETMVIVEAVLKTALRLPVEDRAVLAERLLESLDDLDERASDPSLGEGVRAATHLKSLRSKVYINPV
ncbi:hypothetical protein [Lamprocystis purpurea]|uniref:hypothetical protein n=1 Tax=Lamprocystis purpurea TaxID=61598 RepID=UPI0012FA1522|nr:hypothetical protein [Lamprocystis purpurea]